MAVGWSKIRAESISEVALTALPPTLKLPALPHSVTQFVQKSRDPSVPISELAKLVETETALTLELLKFGIGVRNDFPLSRRCQTSSTDRFQDGTLQSGIAS
jgi:hypothetical protein